MKGEAKLKGLLRIKGIGYIALALFAGIALLLFSGNGEDSNRNLQSVPSSEDYATELERDAERLIRAIDGVKSCTVAITLESGYHYHYAYDQRVNLSYAEDGTVTGKQTETSYKTVTADGDSALVLVKEVTPTVKGAAVVCKGISDGKAAEIKVMLSALFGIDEGRIHIEN